MRRLGDPRSIVVLLSLQATIGCGAQNDAPADAAEAAADSGAGDALSDASDGARFDAGAGCPSTLPTGACDTPDLLCVYLDRCVVPSESSIALKCTHRDIPFPFEWTHVGGRECWKVLDASGCPAGGAMPGEYCATPGKSCSYPAQCALYKTYQIATCTKDDAKGASWSAMAKDCGS